MLKRLERLINRRIRVAVTQRIDYIQSYKEKRDSLDRRITEWFNELDFLSFPVPNTLFHSASDLTNIQKWIDSVSPEAILLSGGNDIGDYEERDTTEKFLLDWAQENKIPTLGICRGLQMMNVWLGGSLKTCENHVRVRHDLSLTKPSEIWPKNVNSYHEWTIDNCAEDLIIKAKSDDGSIEAVESKLLPWEGWMWHPEREETFSKEDNYRVKKLFHA